MNNVFLTAFAWFLVAVVLLPAVWVSITRPRLGDTSAALLTLSGANTLVLLRCHTVTHKYTSITEV